MKFKFPIQAGFKLPELMSTRARSAPKRFDDEVFLPGANNKHTAGRKVDAGHEADPALGLSERESAALHAAERREKIAEKNFIVDDLDDAADAVEDAWRADEELRLAADADADDHDACVCTTTIQSDLKAGMHDELLAHFAFFCQPRIQRLAALGGRLRPRRVHQHVHLLLARGPRRLRLRLRSRVRRGVRGVRVRRGVRGRRLGVALRLR